ncbi:Ni/Fe hydrogenase subunit alpha [Chloroflexus aggregans]|uniref:Nickel-dependent hydrogenase large subunit n=1 Tax=Chloroflexus aggregans (strain MD-66 / DSM 9485) TaxID=326427 RepID=B8G3U6_CHLAD|nr:Ni/Fe hydrogenase subunit alpha [Chloroflexus aggregans]ACL25348.1 nickel-dependent hydrogenase large subunit [Chloroflexus aggregans DSM 9485]
MGQRIVIDPVTRIEGHAKISIHLDDNGNVAETRFHVTEFRGFERFCIGRPFWEMPGITARICGICPVSHLLASARTGDALLAVQIPPAAEKLRRLMNLGQIIQSHSLSFFHLSGPDLMLGFDSEPTQRNIFGLIAAEPDVARKGIRLRQFGQEVIELLGGRKIHPAWAVPGGVRSGLTESSRDRIRSAVPEMLTIALDAMARLKRLTEQYQREVTTFGVFPSLYLGMVGPGGRWMHYGGKLRIIDHTGKMLIDDLDPIDYRDVIGEAVEPWSYLKFPYIRAFGYPQGMYRVGPLARLNVCASIGTPRADAELQELREQVGPVIEGSFYYHHARLIEIIAALEHIEMLIEDDDLLSPNLRADAGVNRYEAVGVSEAPRGTLFHHYRVDEKGLITDVNLIIATGQNNLAINRTVGQIAQNYICNGQFDEGILNRIEAGVRAYDPCLSCSTHAIGQMAMEVELYDSHGTLVGRLSR